MAEQMVLIRNADGAEYVVSEADFRKAYAGTDFKIVSNEDKSEYEGDKSAPKATKESAKE